LERVGSQRELPELSSFENRTGDHSKGRRHNEDVEVACEEYPDFFMIFCYRRSSMVFCRGDGRRDELVFWVWFGDLGNDLVSSVCFGQLLGYQ